MPFPTWCSVGTMHALGKKKFRWDFWDGSFMTFHPLFDTEERLNVVMFFAHICPTTTEQKNGAYAGKDKSQDFSEELKSLPRRTYPSGPDPLRTPPARPDSEPIFDPIRTRKGGFQVRIGSTSVRTRPSRGRGSEGVGSRGVSLAGKAL